MSVFERSGPLRPRARPTHWMGGAAAPSPPPGRHTRITEDGKKKIMQAGPHRVVRASPRRIGHTLTEALRLRLARAFMYFFFQMVLGVGLAALHGSTKDRVRPRLGCSWPPPPRARGHGCRAEPRAGCMDDCGGGDAPHRNNVPGPPRASPRRGRVRIRKSRKEQEGAALACPAEVLGVTLTGWRKPSVSSRGTRRYSNRMV